MDSASSRGLPKLKIKCYKGRCRHNLHGECARSLVTIDELGMCTDARDTSQYPQEMLRSKGHVKRPAQPA